MAPNHKMSYNSTLRQNVFFCSVCERGFSQKGNLKRHILTHTGEKPFHCSKCIKKYTTKYELKIHILTHSEDNPFQCSVCQKTFTRSNSLKRHLITHSNKTEKHHEKKQNKKNPHKAFNKGVRKIFQSDEDCVKKELLEICSHKSYVDIFSCDQDSELGSTKGEIKEDLCVTPGEGVENYLKSELLHSIRNESLKEISLKKEIATETDGVLYDMVFESILQKDETDQSICTLPGKLVDDYLKLEISDIREENVNEYKNITDKRLKENLNIYSDKEKIKTTANMLFDKQLSGIRLKEESFMKSLCKTASKNLDKVYKLLCYIDEKSIPRCGKADTSEIGCAMPVQEFEKYSGVTTITNNMSSKGHITKVSQIIPSENHISQCEICGEEFHKKKLLKKHLITHTGKFQCSECLKKYSAVSDLKKHMLNHKREFQCPVCERMFSQKGNMKRHIYTHSQEKPFHCSDCGKMYSTKYELKRHIHTHSGGSPFQCYVCQKRFTKNNSLKRHMLLHTGETPFSCFECGKGFTQRFHLKKHILSHSDIKLLPCVV